MKQICRLCPRECITDRENGAPGYCQAPAEFVAARASLHMWEEPSISGTRGSGTVFFSGCNLRCVFCQNRDISRAATGKRLSQEELARVLFALRDAGAHNINLVTPTPYAHLLVPLLREVKPKLGIPVVYNCGGYESVEALRALEGLVDIYLPDIKYFDEEIAKQYSQAPNYFPKAMEALAEMLRQTGAPVINGEGLLQRGTVVRHLVLPGHRKDSLEVLNRLAARFGTHGFLLSLMSQYTPDFALDCPYPSLRRKVTTFEYDNVLQKAVELGFQGYLQDRGSASASFTPDFEERSFL